MFSPEIITYTFYRNEEDLFSRKNKIFLEKKFEINEQKVLNFSRSINGFNFTYGGDSVSIPICNEKYIEYADTMLAEGLIDAYCAGKLSDQNKAEWFYKGKDLAVLLILAEKSHIKISRHELKEVLDKLSVSTSGYLDREVSGFDKGDFTEMLEKNFIGYAEEFKFIQSLKKKYRNKKFLFF